MLRRTDPKGLSLSRCLPNCKRALWFVHVLEQMRQQQRVLRKTNRELERDRGQLDRQEKQLVCLELY